MFKPPKKLGLENVVLPFQIGDVQVHMYGFQGSCQQNDVHPGPSW